MPETQDWGTPAVAQAISSFQIVLVCLETESSNVSLAPAAGKRINLVQVELSARYPANVGYELRAGVALGLEDATSNDLLGRLAIDPASPYAALPFPQGILPLTASAAVRMKFTSAPGAGAQEATVHVLYYVTV